MLWRKIVTALASEYPDVELSHMYVDNAAMQLVRNPKQVSFTFGFTIFCFSSLVLAHDDTLVYGVDPRNNHNAV